LLAPDIDAPIQLFAVEGFEQLVGSHFKQLETGTNFLGSQNFFAVDCGVKSAGSGFVLVVQVLPAKKEQEILVQEGELGNFADEFVISLNGKRRGLSQHLTFNVLLEIGKERRCNLTHVKPYFYFIPFDD